MVYPLEGIWKQKNVYIPIWLYSNAYEKEQIGWIQEFTFQYGYIQICLHLVLSRDKAGLHSNMVIFKL